MRILYSITWIFYRGVAQVVARYFREVEAAGSSPVTPRYVQTVKSACSKGFAVFYLHRSACALHVQRKYANNCGLVQYGRHDLTGLFYRFYLPYVVHSHGGGSMPQ